MAGFFSAGKAAQAGGALAEGNAGRTAAEFDARVSDENARIEQANAEEQVERQRRLARRFLGRARASTGASGITISGSALEAIGDSAAELELDALTIKHESDIRVFSLKTDAENARLRGRLLRTKGQLTAISKLLGG